MSTPVRPEPDPFSLALGRIEGRLDGLEKRLDSIEIRLATLATKAELRAVGLMVSGLYGLVILGFTALGWLVTRR
jgi:tetrahydromethanopterin S-methyltransferase subunit G